MAGGDRPEFSSEYLTAFVVERNEQGLVGCGPQGVDPVGGKRRGAGCVAVEIVHFGVGQRILLSPEDLAVIDVDCEQNPFRALHVGTGDEDLVIPDDG